MSDMGEIGPKEKDVKEQGIYLLLFFLEYIYLLVAQFNFLLQILYIF